jgi:hypothetical protein
MSNRIREEMEILLNQVFVDKSKVIRLALSIDF